MWDKKVESEYGGIPCGLMKTCKSWQDLLSEVSGQVFSGLGLHTHKEIIQNGFRPFVENILALEFFRP